MRKCLLLTILMLSLAGLNVHDAQALPRNFRNVDTFLVGGMPDEDDMTEFKELGISTIISLHKLPPEVMKKAKKYGIAVYSFPLRTRLLHIEEIMGIIRESPRNSVYVHCLHGADRTGAVTAYWLTTERNIDPFKALASVLSPSEYHVKGLRQLGNEYGVCLYDIPPAWLGVYAGATNGGLEGLKICGNEWYTRLARNFLFLTLGAPLNPQNEKFWNKYNHTPATRDRGAP